MFFFFFFKQKTAYEIYKVTGVQTCALPILRFGGGTVLMETQINLLTVEVLQLLFPEERDP